MKQDKSKWVEDVLESTAGMVPASPRADLYGQLRARLGREIPKGKRIPLAAMSAAAACLLVLFALNITAVSKYAKADIEAEEAATGNPIQDVVDYYELGSNNLGL